MTRIVRQGAEVGMLKPAVAERRLPAVSFLQARDRLPPGAASGPFGDRLGRPAATSSDASAAEALVKAVEKCCCDGVRGELLLIEEPERGAPAAALNGHIRAIASPAPVIAFDSDFEAVAGIRSHHDKVLHAWQRFGDADRSAVPGPLAEVVLQAVALRP